MGCVSKDKNSESTIRLNYTGMFKILSDFNFNLPHEKFEKVLQDVLNAKIVGQPITPGLKYVIATTVAELAEKIHVKTEDIIAYLAAQPEESLEEFNKRLKNWRKEYYGSMDKSSKQELLSSLDGKLRDDVLDQIRKA